MFTTSLKIFRYVCHIENPTWAILKSDHYALIKTNNNKGITMGHQCPWASIVNKTGVLTLAPAAVVEEQGTGQQWHVDTSWGCQAITQRKALANQGREEKPLKHTSRPHVCRNLCICSVSPVLCLGLCKGFLIKPLQTASILKIFLKLTLKPPPSFLHNITSYDKSYNSSAEMSNESVVNVSPSQMLNEKQMFSLLVLYNHVSGRETHIHK